MRLIDADRLKRVLIAFFTGSHLELPHISEVIGFLNNAPTVDAAQVVHGEWKVWSDDHNAYDCSACGTTFVLYEGTPEDNDWNYCPDCGAKMDGGT